MKSISIATSKFVVRALEGVLLLVVVAVALVVWRLAQGPLDLDQAAPYLESSLTDLTPGVAFDIEHVRLSWAERRSRPTFEIRDVRLRNASSGEVIASFAAMEAMIDLPSLLRGDVSIEHIGLFSPVIRLIRRADGRIEIGLTPTADSAPAGPDAAPAAGIDWLAAALAPAGDGPPEAAALESIEIRDSTLVLADEQRGTRWLVPNAEVQLLRQENDIQMGASLPILDGERTITIDLAGRYVYAARSLALTVTFDGARPAQLVAFAGLSPDLQLADMPLRGTVDTTVVFNGTLPQVSLLSFDLSGGAGTVQLPATLGGPRALAAVSARGSINADFDQIALQALTLQFAGIDGDPTLTVSGAASGLRASPSIDLSAAAPVLSLAALKQLWPAGVKPNTISWITKNLNGGTLSNVSASVRLDGLDFDALRASDLDLRADLAGVRVNYIDGMPNVENTAGRLAMDLREAVITVTSGEIPDAVSDRGLRIVAGDLRMGDLTQDRQEANFTIDIAGDLSEALRLIDNEPLKYAAAMGIDPASSAGASDIRLKLKFPLIKALRLADLAIDVTAEVNDARIENVAFGLPLNDGMISLRVTGEGLDAQGTAKLGPIRTGLTWRENFGGGEFRSQYALDVILENEHRALVALGRAPFIAPYIDGPVRAEVVYRVMRDKTARLAAAADLTGVTMAIPELGWNKPAGAPASGEAEVSLMDGRLIAVDRFSVTAGEDLSIAGRAAFGADNALSSIAVDDGRVGPTRLSVAMAMADDGAMELDVRGAAFDASYFWKELDTDERRGETDWQPVRLKAAIDRMWLSKLGHFDAVTLKFARDRRFIRAIDFASAVTAPDAAESATATPFAFALTSDGDTRNFTGGSADAGGVLRAIGLFDDIVGGKLAIDGQVTPAGKVEGRAEIEDFKLVEAPMVARLLSVAALGGIVDELQGTGISFRVLRVPFTFAASQLGITDGEMFGNTLGLTMSGSYRFPDSYIDMEGTLVPAYALNSALNF
ncbi:MAG: DUF3971 domain-containing protein, partial [Rhodospirillaceae bacterium]|nr:DUF3971 domain-containing protein [Rhodospirillaceae bacterium]